MEWKKEGEGGGGWEGSSFEREEMGSHWTAIKADMRRTER